MISELLLIREFGYVPLGTDRATLQVVVAGARVTQVDRTMLEVTVAIKEEEEDTRVVDLQIMITGGARGSVLKAETCHKTPSTGKGILPQNTVASK